MATPFNMTSREASIYLYRRFPYPPTDGQKHFIVQIMRFLLDAPENALYVLKGYAGTGKTTAVSQLVNALPALRLKSVLLAPTGRAAKVISSYSGHRAYTIHRKIYRHHINKEGQMQASLMPNKHRNTLFIVDEASMIAGPAQSENAYAGTRNLLDDLINFVYNGHNCRLLLIGDTAQLPPVGYDQSPALDLEFLQAAFAMEIHSLEFTEVVRQAKSSGILNNATALRHLLSHAAAQPAIRLQAHADVIPLTGMELEDALNDSYNATEEAENVIICRSNKRAVIFNQEIRSRILFRDAEICAGDLLMVVKNNYYWLPENSPAGFIANGDMAEILKIVDYQEFYGFRFADVIIRLIDYPDEKELEVKILLDTLASNHPALSREEYRNLFQEVLQDYQDIPQRAQRIEQVKNNPWFNALQVKFGYSLTCHKTQGGQWHNVFIDQGYLTEEMIDTSYLRWLYTAITRATGKVYLINFHDRFFGITP